MFKNIVVFLVLVFSLFFVVPEVSAQDASLSKKEKKAEKKRLKEEQNLADWNKTKKMANDHRFVFKANQLFTKEGSVSLDPKINFFYVVGDYAVIQLGFDGVFIGGNGVGGITSEGTVNRYEVKAENHKKPVQVELTVKPKAGQGIGVGTLVVKFYGDGYGEMIINSSGFRLKGQLETLEDTRIHVGNKL